MLFTTQDPLRRNVALSPNTWRHIQDYHPEFTSWEPFQKTIEDPNIIGPSNTHQKREIYYKIEAHPKYPKLYVCVVAEFKGESGIMTTGHLASKPTKISTEGYTYVKI